MLFNNEQYFETSTTEQNFIFDEEHETGLLNVDATGKLIIVNTGGSDAAAGGMGSGSKDKTEKGDLANVKGNNTRDKDRSNNANSHDPVGKEIKKAEEETHDDE